MKLFNRINIQFGKEYTISDLNTSKQVLSAIDIRPKVNVMIIDDEGFAYKEELRNANFSIQCVTKIEDFNAVEAYPIVICDVKGVGTNFDPNNEGIYVIRELKKKYPFKQYAIYSSHNFKIESTEGLEGVYRIKKDVDIDMWSRYIDELIRKATDPKENWKLIRTFLLNKEVNINEVQRLESNYVEIILNRPEKLREFPDRKGFPNITQDIRDIIQGMIAGCLLKVIGV